jgi:hydrogenase maturation factor
MNGSAIHRPSAGSTLRLGKLPPALLQRLLRWRGVKDGRVLVGPGCGVDAAVVRIGSRGFVLKSDPVTFTTTHLGWYVVQVNANDVAVMGARPCWFQPTILLPPGTRPSEVLAIVRDIDLACRTLGIAVTGGHTEVTDGVSRAIVAGDMQGLLVGRRPITAAGARPGDVVLLTKAAGVEGTAILSHERARELRRVLPAALLRRAQGFRRRPGISVVREALVATRHGASAMHDPTEGGVRAALHELAHASGVRLRIELDRVAIRPETDRLCRHFGIDPLGLIGSGALLVAIAASRVAPLLRAWQREGIVGQVIGEVERGRGVLARRGGRLVPFPWVAQDEIVKALGRPMRQTKLRASRRRAIAACLPGGS